MLFAFDPKRQAILLVGGNKAGNKKWYKENIPIADKRYRGYLETIKEEKS
ncbi:type II toxin-antitoxin system RelE/ParE family toxin [Aphanizomenon sp. UHCC 0183]